MNYFLRHSILFTAILACSFAIGCKSSQTIIQNDSREFGQSLEDLSVKLVEVIQTNDLSLAEQYYPDPEIARFLSPEDTKDLTDAEIRNKMLRPLKERLAANIENIRNGIIEHGLEFTDLAYISFTKEPSDDPDTVPRVLSIKVKAGELKGSIPITYLEHNGNHYLFEILISTNTLK